MRTSIRLSFWLLAIAVAGGAIYQAARPEPPKVTAHVIGRGRVEATVANTRAGTVHAKRRAKLAPSLGGQVQDMLVKEGDRVRSGQLLIELWHGDLDAELALAKSELERARALAERAKIEAAFAEREAKRQQDLERQQISPPGRVDRLSTEAKAAQAAQRAAEAAAASKRARIATIEAQIERMRITAPFDGIVAEVNGEIGEFVTPSPVGIPTPPAVDLIDDAAPYVTAPIDEVDAARVRVGMTARITLDAFGNMAFTGRVRRIAPYVADREKQARTVDIEVDFVSPPNDIDLLPGYSADVEILIEAKDDVLRIPTECLRDGDTVLVVGDDGILASRTIRIGLSNWRHAEVLDGLREGERAVSSFSQVDLAAGMEVRVDAPDLKP